ncbi:MAG: ABC transporter substrate-binding protein, partial [Cyanobacteria bacterium J06621_11]
MSLKARKILCLIVSIAALLLTLYAGGVFERSKSLTIAIASGSQDLEAVRGAQAYIDVVNQQGGIDGKPIKLEVFDDSNDSETAVKIAEEIATKSEALAVIGHRYSGTSIAAGEIYKEYGIPAISGSATAEAVTRGNAWYFRALFNNAAQARFLAQYTRKVLNQPTALIVYEPEEAYSSSLADAFELGFREFGGQIPHQFELSSGEELRQQVRRVANEIADLPAQEVGFVALLTSGNTAQAFVNAFKREGLSYLIAGGDALSSQNFINAFEIYANEQRRPGYYTDGIYSVAPLIYDVVDEEGARFRQQYLRQYQEEPSWVAGSFYDSARAMVKALELANVSGEPSEIATERQRVRDAIATFNDLDYAIDGISGPLYFDGSGDAQQIPTIGILERNKLTPAFNQLTPIVVPKSKSELEQGVESGEVVQFGSQFLNRTDIVYTGIRPTSIYEIHLEDDTFKMDFDMWFRYRSDLSEAEITNIRFINALNEPLLEQPSVQTQEDGTTYSLYKLSGTFSLDYLNPEDRGLGERVLSVSFINEQLSRSRLLYVTDSLGLNLSQTFSLKERLEAEQVLNSEPNWQVSKATFFQGLAQRELLNSPTASASSDGFNFAQFNLAITIVPNEISLRRTLHDRWAAYLFSVGIAMLALLFLQRRYRFFKLDSRAQWALKAVAALATLFALEPLTVDWLEQLITINYLEVV